MVSSKEKKRVQKIKAEIKYLKNIKDAWCHGAGKAFTTEWLQSFNEILTKNYPIDLSIPSFLPLVDEMAQCIWKTPRGSVCLVIKENFENSEFDVADLRKNTFTTKEIDLTSSKQWVELSNIVNGELAKFNS